LGVFVFDQIVPSLYFKYLRERMKLLPVFFILCMLCTLNAFSQKRVVTAVRTSEKIIIDGSLQEGIWQSAPIQTNFLTYQPTNGQKSQLESDVMVAYNDRAIYVAAFLKDHTPDSIYNEPTIRDDDNGNADMFGIDLNPNNDGQNSYMLWITAANVQTDIRVSTFDSDYSWDAVWESGVQLCDSGWMVEVRIPWSSIRFPNNASQIWGINFYRSIRRTREVSSYNLVDKKSGTKTEQMAEMHGISNIEAPLRLSFTPYLAAYLNHYSELSKPAYAFNGGLDMKLGLSESYTLDMTLIPDFGQEKSDNIVLNLSPYETYYEERRPFFTEGTELFNKCGLFYSRRIGSTPDGFNSVDTLLDDGYTILKNPNQSRLINAFKITGRDKNNLAVGFFNAITANTYARVTNPLGESEKLLTEHWANYNMIVVDKAFNKNSYVNLTNANVVQPGNGFLSNVLGTSFRLMDKQNKFGIKTNAAWSYYKRGNTNQQPGGFNTSFGLGKFNGSFNYGYSVNVESDRYNPNAMGFLQQNNEFSQTLSFAYNIFEPKGNFNTILCEVYSTYSRLYSPNTFTGWYLHFWNYALTKKQLSIWNNLHFDLTKTNDYFEPRVSGRFVKWPQMFYDNIYLSTDYRKRLAIDFVANLTVNTSDYRGFTVEISPRLRLNKHIILIVSFNADNDWNDYGYVENSEDNVFFGKRNIGIYTSSLGLNWVFTNKIYLQLSARHYWSKVDYRSFYLLNEDGSLAPVEITFTDKNINFNAFNVDLLFSWNFAPGSFLNFSYKNNIYNMEYFDTGNIFPRFGENFTNTLQQPQWNTISLKLMYYIDWQYFKKSH